jgi:SAM-dependent methyltransferase
MFEKIRRWIRFNLLYLGRPPWDTGVSPPELTRYLSSAEPGWALDVGCGTGTNLLTMAERGWEVMGVDMAWLPVLQARMKLRNAGVDGRIIHGDVTEDLNLKPRFDLVLDIGCYHSLTQGGREAYVENLKQWVKPGGTYLIYAHQRTATDSSHGITETDRANFEAFLHLTWRQDSDEQRPDGGGGRPSVWMRFDRLHAG